MLPDAPSELVRHDSHFKELGLDKDYYETAEQVIALLLEHPRLMQRPVIVSDGKAVIARPAEKVLDLLG